MSAKVFLGFGIGIILGLIFQKDILWLQPIGDLFLKLIKMIVVPVVFLSIISGISSIGDIWKIKTHRNKGSRVLYCNYSTFCNYWSYCGTYNEARC